MSTATNNLDYMATTGGQANYHWQQILINDTNAIDDGSGGMSATEFNQIINKDSSSVPNSASRAKIKKGNLQASHGALSVGRERKKSTNPSGPLYKGL